MVYVFIATAQPPSVGPLSRARLSELRATPRRGISRSSDFWSRERGPTDGGKSVYL
jgi:hypothetical protein